MIESVEKLIKSGKFPPVILLFGEEELLIEEAYNKLISSLCKTPESRYDFEIFDGDGSDIMRIIDSCSSFPFIAERRVVAVKNFDKIIEKKLPKKEAEKSPLARYLNEPLSQTILILLSGDNSLNGTAAAMKKFKDKESADKKINSIKFPYNIILKKYGWIEFPRTYESQYPKWVTSRFKSHGKVIAADACELLVAHTNPSLRDLNNEIEKLLLFVQDRNKITKSDVAFISGSSKVYNIFELQKAMGARNLKDSLLILENMLSADSQEILILTMLLRYFVVIWKLIEEAPLASNNYQLAAKVGVNSFFINDYLSAIRNYSPSEIDRAFILLAETEEKLKSTQTDTLYLMQNMLIRIMDKNKHGN